MPKIGFVGFGNHALRLDKCLWKIFGSHELIRYHPTKKEHQTTNRFDDLYDCDLVFITSPNQTHFKYIKKLLCKSKVKIFCEKPPCTSIVELDQLMNLNRRDKQRVFFNFNYRYSNLCKIIQSSIADETIGNIIHIYGVMSHGLAFKDGYQKSWRGKYPKNESVVLDTSLIHLIDLCNYILGGSLKINSSLGSSFKHGQDSYAISLRAKNEANISLFGSYAAPYYFSFTVLGTDGFIEANDSSLVIKRPRDSFNEKGFFITPPTYLKEDYAFELDYESSLERAVNHFVSLAMSGENFCEREFDLSLETTKIVLNAQIEH